MEERYGVIYKITNKINNKIYIGQTINSFDERYGNTLINTHNDHLRSAIKKHGIENFYINKDFDIAYSKEELDTLEDMYIQFYNTTNNKYGYNKRFGGSRGKNTKETRMKISNTLKVKYQNSNITPWNKGKSLPELCGENNPFYGKHHTDATRLKMSKNHWSKKGMCHPMQGKRLSKVTKLKISKAIKGKYLGVNNKNYTSVIVECDVCGNEHVRKLSTIGKYNFCSSECRSKGITLFHSGENSKLYNKKSIKCSYCGIEIKKCDSQIGKYNYCSLECKNKHQKSKLTYGDNPNAKKIICLNNMDVFNCIKDACGAYKVGRTSVTDCCKGRKSSVKGFEFMYYEDYLKLHMKQI